MGSEGIGLMDLAAAGREFPQFGKSVWNTQRSSSQVFGKSDEGCGCGCGGRCRGNVSSGGCGSAKVAGVMSTDGSGSWFNTAAAQVGGAARGKGGCPPGVCYVNGRMRAGWMRGSQMICSDPECYECGWCDPPTPTWDACPPDALLNLNVCRQFVARAEQAVAAFGDFGWDSDRCRQHVDTAKLACAIYDASSAGYGIDCPPTPGVPECPVAIIQPQCCIRILCRPMTAWFGFYVPGINHCVVEKASCDGERTIWESTPSSAEKGNETYGAGEFTLEGAIRKTHNKEYFTKTDPGPEPEVVAEHCDDCQSGQEGGFVETEACQKINDEYIRSYPGAGKWGRGLFTPSCNSLASFVEREVMGTSNTCENWRNWGSAHWQRKPFW